MNGMIGADPDALERLAGDFDRGAGSLEATALRIRVSVLANPWAGPRATRFRNDWDHRHGPQLKRTAAFLRAAAKQLRQQAQEQRQASSAGGAGGAGSGSRATSPGVLATLVAGLEESAALKGLSILGTSAGFVSALGGWNRYQNYPKDYRLFMEGLSRSKFLRPFVEPGRIPDLMKFNKSPILQAFERSGVTATLKPYSTVLGQASRGLGIVGAASSTFIDGYRMFEAASTASKPSDWVRTATHGVDAAANVAMASKVGALPGLAAKSVAMAVREGSKADWSSEGRLLVYDTVVNDPGIVVEEFGKATKQVGQEVLSWLIPIEKGLK